MKNCYKNCCGGVILDVWSAFMGPVIGSRSLVYQKMVIYGKKALFSTV